MNSKAQASLVEKPSEPQLLALVSLLADDDTKIFKAVRLKLISIGPSVISWLKPHFLSQDPTLRRHAREIVLHFQRKESDSLFLEFCETQGEDLDLERGIGLLARTQYPEANLEALSAQLDQFAAEVRVRSLRVIAPQQRLLILNQYLFAELKFHGNPHYETDAENCYFNRILERRTGNPIGLCAVYLLLCRRLDLPVSGVGLPGHFLCRFQSPTMEIFIDCFNAGRFLTKADCIKHLHETQHGLDEGYLAPVNTRRILMRTCANLQQTYLRGNQVSEAEKIKRYLVALAS
jgi:regulator of sirC expression with transglutaminase-like and TPR domain